MGLGRRLSTLFIFITLFTFCACSQSGRVEDNSFGFMLKTLLDHSVPELDIAAVGKDYDGYQFVDAREYPEYEVSHIGNAIWVGYDDFDIARIVDVPREDTIVVYCSIGYRSEKIAEKLMAAGYPHVMNLYGGIFEWKNQDREVLDPDGKPTDQVHAFDKKWGIWLNEGEKIYSK